MIVAYYQADNIDSEIKIEQGSFKEIIETLMLALRGVDGSKIFFSIERDLRSGRLKEALQKIDDWSEEYNSNGKIFTYTIK